MLRFFACRNYGDARGQECPRHTSRNTQSAGGEHGRVGIGSYGDVGCESERGGAIVEGAGNFRQRSEKRFHAGEIEQSGVAGGVFHAGGERLGAVEQGGVRGGFLQRRTRTQCEFRAQFGLGLGHAWGDAHAAAFSLTAMIFSSGGLPSRMATARARSSGSARSAAATGKFGT